MKKTTLQILLIFFIFTNFVNAQITAGMFDVRVNNSSIENCSTIALGNNSSVNVTFTLRVTKPSPSTDVGPAAQFKIFLKKNSTDPAVQINGIIVNNSFFGGTSTWEGTFSTTIAASSIDVTGSNFYGEYSHSSTNSPAKTCIYKLTKNPSPTFEISPKSQPIYCEQRTYNFSVTNVYGSPGTLSYKWYLGYGWSINGSSVPGNTVVTTTTNSIALSPTDFTVIPSEVTVVPVLNGVDQPSKTCTVARSGFSPTLLSIDGGPAICYQTASSIYTIPNLHNNLTVTWSSSNNAIATVTNSGNQAVIVPVSKGTFTLTALLRNPCGQTFALTKNVAIVGSPVANFTAERVERYVFNYRGQDMYNDFSTYTWQLVASSGYVDFFSASGGLGILTAYPPFSATFKLTATNSCGSDEIYFTQALNNEDEEISRVAGPLQQNINENEIENPKFDIYPNPSNSIVHIKLKDTNSKTKLNSQIYARLYDLNGTQKREIKIDNQDNSLNVEGLKKGVYILKINNNGKEESNKILIN
ncbi:T9SS type A sorting domain-containing protein [Flavobacterium hungaricum]|uniref:T9SS C-terminal target domain-containing protein n=1 Tax=Flavobacterium hungaricum TaxID=2082725 RepID=A0ABR9TGA5_9FLAO|nr:T9SS type A sorting domain-containing protein [Flavobacterium hungaricum]MBE8724062.1 T9SS C-terminal target domain-containing protein [Flavobacterium hungaricum]